MPIAKFLTNGQQTITKKTMQNKNIENFNEFVEAFKRLKAEIGRTIVGQEKVIDDVLIAIFSKGHGLLVGVQELFCRV